MSVKITITITENNEGDVNYHCSARGAAGKHSHPEAKAASALVKTIHGYLQLLKAQGAAGLDENCDYMYPNQVKH